MMKFHHTDHADLLPHATTDRERAALEAIIEHGHGPTAAAACGVTLRALHLSVRRVRVRALKAAAGVVALPGMYVHSVATDGDGQVKAIRHRLEDQQPAEADPLPPGHVIKGVSQLVDGTGRELLRWTKSSRVEQERWQAYADAVRALAAEVPPAAPAADPTTPADADLCSILPWGDPHIGALAWAQETGQSWDLKVAEEITTQVLADLINRTPRSAWFGLVDLGDLFHAEDDKQATPTAGHKLDVDSRAGKIARVALRMCRQAIDLGLLRHERVWFRALRGNHDPYKTLMLTIWLEAIYVNEPRVIIEPSDNPYQFWTFGRNAWMWHHGDGSKPQQMPGVFSCDPSWGQARWRYIQTGHIHSQNRWDFPGCTVESFRTVFPGDYWSHWKGYRSGRTLDCITYHKDLGEISRVQQGVVAR